MLGSELDTRDGKCTRRVCRTPRNEIIESRSIAVVSTAQRRRRKKTSIAVAFAGQYTKVVSLLTAARCRERSHSKCLARSHPS